MFYVFLSKMEEELVESQPSMAAKNLLICVRLLGSSYGGFYVFVKMCERDFVKQELFLCLERTE